MTSEVAIVNSGGANIASLTFALERLGVQATLTSDATQIRRAKRVILPGVGAAADAMQRLTELGVHDVISQLTQPVLGICLGMQLLCSSSREDDAACLGILPGHADKLPADADTPVPHMGWSQIHGQQQHPLLDGIGDGSWFYFVHSFALPVDETTLATAMHGREFSAIAACRNFYATQFHPERSAIAGARLLRNFMSLPV